MRTPKPTHYLFVTANTPMITFTEIQMDEFQAWRRHSDQVNIFDFNGQIARIVVLCEDNQFSREEALKTATMFVEGAYQRIDVDLDKCVSITTQGIDLRHPPY